MRQGVMDGQMNDLSPNVYHQLCSALISLWVHYFWSCDVAALHSSWQKHTHTDTQTVTPYRTTVHMLQATALFMIVTSRSKRMSRADLWVPMEPYCAVTTALCMTVTEVSFLVKLIHHVMWFNKTKRKIGWSGWIIITQNLGTFYENAWISGG